MSAKRASTDAKKKKVATKKKATSKKAKKTKKVASKSSSEPSRKTLKKRVVEEAPLNKKKKLVAGKKSKKTNPDLNNLDLPDGYLPKKNEEYMSPLQLLYFQNKLYERRSELINQSQETLHNLKTEIRDVSDDAERASRESDNILELRTRDRYRKLLSKIDSALRRVDDGSYGYCEETGEEIGLGRLEARPTATLTVDAQERREMLQRQFRDDR